MGMTHDDGTPAGGLATGEVPVQDKSAPSGLLWEGEHVGSYALRSGTPIRLHDDGSVFILERNKHWYPAAGENAIWAAEFAERVRELAQIRAEIDAAVTKLVGVVKGTR